MRKRTVKARSLSKNEVGDHHKTAIDIQGDVSRGGPSALSVERVLRPRRHTYAEKVIDDPRRFDAIEVHDVCRFSDPERPDYEEPVCDRDTPSGFSVYAHLKDGGIDCCGDFGQRSDALAYGSELASIHHWPMHDYASPSRQSGSDALRRDALLTVALALRDGCLQALGPLDGTFEDDRSAISAIRSVYEAGIAEIRQQLEANKDQFWSKAGMVNGK